MTTAKVDELDERVRHLEEMVGELLVDHPGLATRSRATWERECGELLVPEGPEDVPSVAEVLAADNVRLARSLAALEKAARALAEQVVKDGLLAGSGKLPARELLALAVRELLSKDKVPHPRGRGWEERTGESDERAGRSGHARQAGPQAEALPLVRRQADAGPLGLPAPRREPAGHVGVAGQGRVAGAAQMSDQEKGRPLGLEARLQHIEQMVGELLEHCQGPTTPSRATWERECLELRQRLHFERELERWAARTAVVLAARQMGKDSPMPASREEMTRQVLFASERFKKLCATCDVVRMAEIGPLRLEQLSDEEHLELLLWATRLEEVKSEMPAILQVYFGVLGVDPLR